MFLKAKDVLEESKPENLKEEVQVADEANSNKLTQVYKDDVVVDAIGRLNDGVETLTKKEVPLVGYDRLSEFVMLNGCKLRGADLIMSVKTSQARVMLTQVHVNDPLFGSQSPVLVDDEFVKLIKEVSDMSMLEDINLICGLQVKQSSERSVVIHSTYAKDSVKWLTLKSSDAKKSPMSITLKLIDDPEDVLVDHLVCRTLIENVLYFTSDLCYSVGVCAGFQSQSEVRHMKAGIKFHYLRDSVDKRMLIIEYIDIGHHAGIFITAFNKASLQLMASLGPCVM